MKHSKNGAFTFIELLITLAVIAVAFLPLMYMFSSAMQQVYVTDDLSTARFLAQEGMEKLKNLNLTEAQIQEIGDTYDPPLDKEPILLNKNKWRVFRKIVKNTDPLEIHISVFKEPLEENQKPVVETATLVEDLDWTALTD